MNSDDPVFRELFQLVKIESDDLQAKHEKIKVVDSLQLFLDAIKQENEEYMHDFLLKDNEYSPVLSDLNTDDFFEALVASSNKSISKLLQIFSSRYTDNKSLNGKSCYYFLSSELEFWKNIRTNIKSYNDKPLKGVLFKQFMEYLIDVIIDKMNQEKTILSSMKNLLLILKIAL